MNWFIKLINLIWKKQVETEINWRNGLKPDTIDHRDILASQVMKAETLTRPLLENYIIPYQLRVINQGQTPTCVGQSGASVKEEKERRENDTLDFEGFWLYNECKKRDGMPDFPGTSFRVLMELLLKVGAKPLGGIEADAEKYRIGGYVSLDNLSIEGIKRAIWQFGAVLLGFIGSNEGWRTAYIKAPKTGEQQWGHATIGIGWNKNYIICQNSWGSEWGDKGLFYFNDSYLPFSGWAVLVDLPNNWKELFPDPTLKPKHFFADNLFQGMRNEEIKILQDCYKWLGVMSKEVESTGYFGLTTLQATKIFQQRYGIPQTGFVGILTRDKLNLLFE